MRSIIILVLFTATLAGCEENDPGAPADVTVSVRTVSERPTSFATMPTLITSVDVAETSQGRQCVTTWHERECASVFTAKDARLNDKLVVKVRESGCLPTVSLDKVSAGWNCTVAKKSFKLSEGTVTETVRTGDETTVITVTAKTRS